MNNHAHQFAFHENVSPEPPSTDFTQLLELAFGGDNPLTRQQKDAIGAWKEPYRLAGWQWRMSRARWLHRILVKVRHYGWEEWYAGDKTAVRAYFQRHRMGRPVEMIDAPRK